jgi:hypothetical protein
MSLDSILDAKTLLFILGMLMSIALAGRFNKSCLRLVWETSLPVGLLGLLIGVISMLAALAEPSGIAPAAAVALMALLYVGTVRLLLSDAHDQPLSVDSSPGIKLASTAGVAAMLGWVMVSLVPGSPDVFWFPQALMLMIAGCILVLLAGRYFSSIPSNGWARKILGLAWLGYLAGLISALPQLDAPQLLGPSMAFALLSLLYGILGTVLGLVWVPDRMADADGSLPLGPLFAASVMVAVVSMMTLLIVVVN